MKKINFYCLVALSFLGACASENQVSNVEVVTPKNVNNSSAAANESIAANIPPKTNVVIPPQNNLPTPLPPLSKPATGEIIFAPSSFVSLPNWGITDLSAARKSLINSCAAIIKKSANNFLSDKAQYAGRISDWLEVCNLAKQNDISDREFFENYFQAWEVKTENSNTGRLTSYFEPVISGSFTPDNINSEALYEKPKDLLTIDLGDFDPSLRAKTIVGRISGNNFIPYLKRGDINPTNTKPIFYTNIGDAISLQIQGSGRINMNDGKQYRAIFTATNGQPFSSPASELIRRGIMELSQASAGNVKKWFETADPKLAREIINSNPRTVFYELQELKDPNVGPKGSQGVPLVAGGSMAIDPSYHAYGVPIFVSAYSGRIKDTQNISRLVITQDTGGAIKGPIRGDLFWGTGVEAGLMAGKVNHDANFWVILPKKIDPTITNPKPKSVAGK